MIRFLLKAIGSYLGTLAAIWTTLFLVGLVIKWGKNTMDTELTILSTEDHYFVDGPETRWASILNELLLKSVDLDELPEGVWKYGLRRDKAGKLSFDLVPAEEG
jgi:hypothetical protein